VTSTIRASGLPDYRALQVRDLEARSSGEILYVALLRPDRGARLPIVVLDALQIGIDRLHPQPQPLQRLGSRLAGVEGDFVPTPAQLQQRRHDRVDVAEQRVGVGEEAGHPALPAGSPVTPATISRKAWTVADRPRPRSLRISFQV
jgi:hypothetical protein